MYNQTLVEVTQADREASWDCRPTRYQTEADWQWWMDGKYDHLPHIQAFARHRHAAKTGQ